jgi:hypothetical protein
VNGGNHPRGGESSFPQHLQSLEKGLEVFLSVVRGPVAPSMSGGGDHSLGKRREHLAVIPEVEPPALPPFIRGHEDGGDVQRRPRLPQLEDTTAGPHCRADPSLPRRRSKKLRGKEMSPQVLVGGDPQVSFAHRHEDGGLRDGVGAEVVQLHLLVVQDRPHEAACRHTEPPLVEGDEAHDVPRRRGRGGSARGRNPFPFNLPLFGD